MCCRLVEVVVKLMGDVFPELKQTEQRIKEIIAEEEASFGKTLLKASIILVFLMQHALFDRPSWLRRS